MSLSNSHPVQAQAADELLERASAGSAEALQSFVDENYEFLLAVVRRHMAARLRSAFDSTDLMQEVRLRILTHKVEREAFASRSRLLAYLSKIAQNVTLASNRKHLDVAKRSLHKEVAMKPAHASALADDHLDPAIVCALRDALECFYRSLPPVYREVMRRSAAGLENDEIGTSTGISATTVQRILERVRNKVNVALPRWSYS